MLKTIGWTLQAFVGETGGCARFGNDEFFMMCKYTEQTINNFKNTLKNNMKEAISLDIYNELKLCIGIYIVEREESAKNIMDNANLARKHAKRLGKGAILFYNQKLLERLYYESKINNQTTRALQDDEFKLYLQPKFEIPSLRIVGAEALVRWHDANGNVLFPDDFIPLFEQNGFIHELDFYMLENVCKFIKDNHLENTNFRISVNFSRVTILHQDFSKELKEMIQKYNVPTHCIELEITESVFYDFSKHTIEMIHELNNEGYVFSMDDFGSGYSSLNSIHTIPVDIIKIDRKFLKESHVSKQVVSIIRLIIETAHLLGKEIICEGVELSSDVELLNELNCHLGQGYYISKPVIKEDFTTLFLTETESKRKKLY
ncbi:GGDEF domain-containing phosphodiesterase [Anaerorhabdus sp.]|uniref:GGDEF domain-containing phosphodiesterase n=1 Tax=Anaerorhabdus sp. TaxID=1872524 RepID=UPI002FCB6A96